MPLQPAVLGSARLGNFRLGYVPTALATLRSTRVTVLIAGVLANARVRIAGLSIHDALNDAPNTCTLTVDTTAPSEGQDLRVLVNSDTPRLLFNGTLQTVTQTYEGKPVHLAWHCTAVDDTTRVNRKRPFGTWTNVSATTIAQYLIATFAPGLTGVHIEADLPTISITFDGSESFSSAIGRIAQAIGGYFYFDDLDLHLFLTEATDTPDDIDGTLGRLLNDPAIRISRDDSQLRTRVYGKGHGEATTTDVAANDPIVPIADVVMFNPGGGQAIAGTTPDGAQSQILAYTGVQLGGVGSLVGPGVAPSVAPTLTPSAGAGVESGVHQGAYTFVTAAGESLPSPLGSVTTGLLAPPDAPSVYSFGTSIGNLGIGVYSWAVTSLNAAGETTASELFTYTTNTFTRFFNMTVPVGPPGTTSRKFYRTVVDGAQLKLHTTIPDNTTVVVFDNTADGSLGANVPTSNTATANQIAVANIAIGPTGTTQRKVYRTVAGGAQLKLQQTIANNTATIGAIDATADASLGANAPTSDTSGLSTETGQVNAGSAELLTAGAGFFSSTGGWVILGGGQVVRYAGISGNTLTGIPATGVGAITTTVPYGSPAIAASTLTGVTGNALAMQKGTAVHIWVQRDDLAAQAALIALDAAQGRVSDGVIEHVISDERRGEASLIALCDADLALFSRPLITVTYATRDTKTKSGKPVTFDLASPLIDETLTIQSVDITEIDMAPGLAPRFTSTASSVRFSLEDILRRLLADKAA